MASVSSTVTLGFNAVGSVALTVSLGFGMGAAPIQPDVVGVEIEGWSVGGRVSVEAFGVRKVTINDGGVASSAARVDYGGSQ